MSLFTVAYAESPAAQPSMENLLMSPQILMLVLMVAIFYFMVLRPQKKREKQTRDMLSALKVGDTIVTIGGIIGTISTIKDDAIVIEVGADKTKITFEKSAIKGMK